MKKCISIFGHKFDHIFNEHPEPIEKICEFVENANGRSAQKLLDRVKKVYVKTVCLRCGMELNASNPEPAGK